MESEVSEGSFENSAEEGRSVEADSLHNESKEKNSDNEVDLQESVNEKVAAAEEETELLIEQGKQEISEIDKEVELPLVDISVVNGELDLKGKLEEIHEKGRSFLASMKERMVNLFTKETENQTNLVKNEVVQDQIINAPLQKGEVFDAVEELSKVMKAPTSDRRELLDEYKDKLNYQTKGLLKMQEQLLSNIQADQNTSRDELSSVVDQFTEKYGLTEEQRSIAESKLDKFQEKHEKVQEWREKYPDDNDLFKALCNRDPAGKVEIIEGPVTFFIKCYSPEDYAYLFSSKNWKEGLDPTQEQIERVLIAGGFAQRNSLNQGLENTMNVTLVKDDDDRLYDTDKTRIHEEQHSLNKLLKADAAPISPRLYDIIHSIARNAFNEGYLDESQVRDMTNYLRENRNIDVDVPVKDEMIAFFKVNDYPTGAFLGSFNLGKEFDPQLNYNHVQAGAEKISAMATIFPAESKIREQVQEIIDELYNAEKYFDYVAVGSEAMVSLQDHGFSKEQIIALMQQEPLSRWSKVAERLIDQEGKVA